MATINAQEVKRLRDQTGAGMMDCKAALEEAKGDFEEATTVLRKKGLATAAKKAGRATTEGLIGHQVSSDHSSGLLVEVNCESDFVARTEEFQRLVRNVLTEIDKAGDSANEDWLRDPGGPIQSLVAAAIGKLGENMSVARFVRYAGGNHVGQYIHMGGKIGAQVEFGGVTAGIAAQNEFKTLVKETAMHIAAASPLYTSRDAVPQAVLDKERAIYRAQMDGSGKPAGVVDKIVEGKLGSYYAQVVLLEQPSIFEPKMTVADRLKAAIASIGAPVTVVRFARLKVGETA